MAVGLYVPPPRYVANSVVKQSSVQVEQGAYGIPLGTWIQARLARNVSSADSGSIELILTRLVPGRVRELPAGTILYGNKAYNAGTKRMDIVINKGITPTGDEFAIAASLYDSARVSGLSGLVYRNRREELKGAMGEGLVAVGRGVLGQASGSTPLATGAASVGESLLANEQVFLDSGPAFTIQVAPQAVLLRVDRSF